MVVLLVVWGLTTAALLASTRLGTAPDSAGRLLAPDFSSFWTAAWLATDGVLAAVWIPPLRERAERESFPAHDSYAPDYYAFFYPPPFRILLVPLGLLPYGPAARVRLVGTGAACLGVIRALLPPASWSWLAVLAFPAFALNAVSGQKGVLSATLLGATAVLFARRRPGGRAEAALLAAGSCWQRYSCWIMTC